MRTTLAVLLAAGLLCAGGNATMAQPDPVPHRGQPQRMARMKNLNLTDAQKKQMEELRTSMQKQAVKLRSSVQLDRIDLRELLKADEPNKAAIEKKLDEIAKLQTEQKMLRINHMLDVRKILTPEQLKIWKEGRHGAMMGFLGMEGGRRGSMQRHRTMRGCADCMIGPPGGMMAPHEDTQDE